MANLQNPVALPTQAEFLQHGLISDVGPEDVTCSICAERWRKDQEIVKVVPCSSCYFHKDCIHAWFKSSHEQRGTCPNDRRVFFKPEQVVSSSAALDDVSGNTVMLRLELLLDSWLVYHDRFWRIQYAAVGPPEIITAWHAARADLTVENVQSNLRDILTLSRRVPEALQTRTNEYLDQMEENFNNLAQRYAYAVEQVVHERCEAILLEIHEKKRAEVYFPHFLEDQVHQLVQEASKRCWRFLPTVLTDTAKLENTIRAYSVMKTK